MESLQLILQIVAGLVGFPAFLAALINVAKWFGLADGYASIVNFWAHVLVYVGVGVAVFFGKVDILPGLDASLGAIAQVLLAILAFLSSIGIAKGFNAKVLRGLPLIGYSHSKAKG
jgi:hypothetical protein